jgi:hypothetical protein
VLVFAMPFEIHHFRLKSRASFIFWMNVPHIGWRGLNISSWEVEEVQ